MSIVCIPMYIVGLIYNTFYTELVPKRGDDQSSGTL